MRTSRDYRSHQREAVKAAAIKYMPHQGKAEMERRRRTMKEIINAS